MLNRFLRAIEGAFERSSKSSLFMRLARSCASFLIKICREALIPRVVAGMIASFMGWVSQGAYRFCSRIYRGSAVMGVLGRAAEHSRWIR